MKRNAVQVGKTSNIRKIHVNFSITMKYASAYWNLTCVRAFACVFACVRAACVLVRVCVEERVCARVSVCVRACVCEQEGVLVSIE